MASPTPLFNRVAYVAMLAGSVLLAMYFSVVFPLAAIALWIVGFDMLRVGIGWNWSRSAAKETVPEEFKRLLIQDLIGPKAWGAIIAVVLFWIVRNSPMNILQLAIYILGLSLLSGALREWRLRSKKEAPKARAVVFVLFLWALYSANRSISSALPVVDLFGFLHRYWLMLPLGLLGAYFLYQAVRLHPVRSEQLMDADE